jgi:hypothetical protein
VLRFRLEPGESSNEGYYCSLGVGKELPMTSTTASPLDEAARKYALKGYTITSRTEAQVILQSPPYRSAGRIFVIGPPAR